MSGGLIELATYGAQNIYLTSNPEITFFKVVYRRHTHFSMESIRVNFDDIVGFDTHSTLTVPKVGDLIHKMYLEIELPEIDLKRCLSDDKCSKDIKIKLNKSIKDYKTVIKFMSINRTAFVESHEILEAMNNSSCKGVISKVCNIFNDEDNEEFIKEFNKLVNNEDYVFNYEEISMKGILDKINDSRDEYKLEDVFELMKIGINKSIKVQDFYFKRVRLLKSLFEDSVNENIKFAWVDRLGHALIKEVEIRIGGDKIDKHYGDWLNIWYELTANRDKEDVYFKMIGNVEELTNFDREVKPRYKLKIPMQFWFNRYSGRSIPMIALEYHDVTFHIKFRKLEEVSYVENKTKICTETCDDLYLDEVSESVGIDLDASLLIDCIFLDSEERKRFAQSSHEYLIDQLQQLEINDLDQSAQNITLKTFLHPVKELIWVSQKKNYVENLSGFNKTRWDNYSLTDENKGNPIKTSQIDFHGYIRTPKLSGRYYNYVQPYQHHYSTPSDGINMYSFALFPEEHQPSSTANFSRLSRVLLALELDKSFLENGENKNSLDNSSKYNFRAYVRNTNILRFLSGFAKVAFHFG